MSKERLEEIKEYFGLWMKNDISRDWSLSSETIDNLKYLIEQAERVQELERVNKQLKGNLSVYKGYYKNMIKINEDVVEENKKYREALEEARNECEEMLDHYVECSGVIRIKTLIDEVLECEE